MAKPRRLDCLGIRDRLKKTRKAQDLSVLALAQAAGISHTTVQYIEEGRRMPGLDTVELLARALKVRAAWLAYGDGEPEIRAAAVKEESAVPPFFSQEDGG